MFFLQDYLGNSFNSKLAVTKCKTVRTIYFITLVNERGDMQTDSTYLTN